VQNCQAGLGRDRDETGRVWVQQGLGVGPLPNAMQVKEDRTLRPAGGDTAELLARKLSDAVRVVANGNGNGAGNGIAKGGNGIGKARARRIAGDIGAAILADVNAGTAEHSDDVVLITEALGERMKVRGEQAGDLLAAARLHDIGKAWIPPELLEKPGQLTASEWELMRQHTLVGERILSSVEELSEVAHLVRHSHERWDGRGYPDGLAGSEIPLGSRIIFCADAFHAIRCDRPYRRGRSAREALAEITRCAGTQFDPQVASALEQVVRERNRRAHSTGGGSTRLLALLMCLVLGGAGSAIARSGALGEASGTPVGGPSPPPGCGTAACPSVAGPVGGLGPVGALSGVPGPRPLSPGLPGLQHRAANGNNGKHLAKGHSKAKHNPNGAHPGKHGKGHAYGHANTASSHGNSGQSQGTGSSSSSGASSGGSSHSSGSSGQSGSTKGHSGSRGHRSGSRGAAHGNAGGNGNGNANGH
jgi:HD-GYP domain-containing protein (c-di-GMP phosphodiesterase class II)